MKKEKYKKGDRIKYVDNNGKTHLGVITEEIKIKMLGITLYTKYQVLTTAIDKDTVIDSIWAGVMVNIISRNQILNKNEE